MGNPPPSPAGGDAPSLPPLAEGLKGHDTETGLPLCHFCPPARFTAAAQVCPAKLAAEHPPEHTAPAPESPLDSSCPARRGPAQGTQRSPPPRAQPAGDPPPPPPTARQKDRQPGPTLVLLSTRLTKVETSRDPGMGVLVRRSLGGAGNGETGGSSGMVTV